MVFLAIPDATVEEEDETSEEQSEEQSQLNGDDKDDEGDRLIQEEMGLPDSDEEQQDSDKCFTARVINKRSNKKGGTALYLAARNGDYDLAMSSIEKGVRVDESDCGWTPLHEACNYGNLDIVKLLLDSGADINGNGDEGMTPLHDATQNAHIDVVKHLIKRGASVTERDNNGHTPLDLVLHSISEDDEDFDPEMAEVREELIRTLTNGSRLQTPTNSDVVPCQDFSKNVSRKTQNSARNETKSKNAIPELDSDGDITDENSGDFSWNELKIAQSTTKTRRKLPQKSDVVSSQDFLENISRKTETSKKKKKKRKWVIRETDSDDDQWRSQLQIMVPLNSSRRRRDNFRGVRGHAPPENFEI